MGFRSLARRVVPLIILSTAVGTCSEPTGPPAVTSLTLDVHGVALVRGDSVILFATGLDAQGTILNNPAFTLSPHDARIVRTHAPGWIVGLQAGSTIIEAVDGGGRDSVVAVVSLPRTVRLTPSPDTLTYIGAVSTLQALANDSTGPTTATFSWTSRNPAVAEVSQQGRVIARGDGSTYVVAVDGLGTRDSTPIVVRRVATRIELAPSPANEPLQRQLAFHATAFDLSSVPIPGATFTWTSTTPAVATVDGAGTVSVAGLGVDTIHALRDGVTGTATLTVRPLPTLHFNFDTIVTGVGLQFLGPPYPTVLADIADSADTFPVAIGISDTSVAAVPSQVLVPNPPDLGPQLNAVVGKRPGLVQLLASAVHYVTGSTALRVTTPRLVVDIRLDTIGLNHMTVGYGVYLADSLRHVERATQSVVIRVSSSDTTVLQPLDSVVTVSAINTGANSSAALRKPGRAWIRFSSPGFLPDSQLVTVTPPHLEFVAVNGTRLHLARVGVSEIDNYPGTYLQTGDPYLLGPVVVTVTQAHPERLGIPTTFTLQPTQSSPIVQFFGVGLAPGPDTVVASAPGYLPDTLFVDVTPATYTVQSLVVDETRLADIRFSVFLADTFGALHGPTMQRVPAQVTSSNPMVLRVLSDSTIISPISSGGAAEIYFAGAGSATLTISDPQGQIIPLVIPIVSRPNQLMIKDPVAPAGFYRPEGPLDLGMRQSLGFYNAVAHVVFLSNPNPLISDSVLLRSTNPKVAAPAVSAVVPGDDANVGGVFDIVSGDSTGVAWIVAEGRGFISDSIRVTVGQPHFAFPTELYGLETQTKQMELEVRDPAGNLRFSSEPIPVDLTSTDPAVVWPDSARITFPANASSTFFTVHLRSPGTASIRAVDPRGVVQRYDSAASAPIHVDPVPYP